MSSSQAAPFFRHRSGMLTLEKTVVMGILNVTPDSFSDGGRFYKTEEAVARALEIEEQGAGILDIGAQSTRPGHVPVSPEEELARLLPVLDQVRPRLSIPISVDTYYRQVAMEALRHGADILNDVSGRLENGLPELAAEWGAGLIMMHAGGGADDREEIDAVTVVREYFCRALEKAGAAGLPLSHVCLDPGIGFGKSLTGDRDLIARLSEVTQGLPAAALLVGASRKRVVGASEPPVPLEERLFGTLALHTVAQWNGANILRVHDVRPAVLAAAAVDAVRERKG